MPLTWFLQVFSLVRSNMDSSTSTPGQGQGSSYSSSMGATLARVMNTIMKEFGTHGNMVRHIIGGFSSPHSGNSWEHGETHYRGV